VPLGLESGGAGREVCLSPRSADATSGFETEHADDHQHVGRRLRSGDAAASSTPASSAHIVDRNCDDAVLRQEIGDVQRREEIGVEAEEVRIVDLIQIVTQKFVEAVGLHEGVELVAADGNRDDAILRQQVRDV